jgi:ACR3 family arsenite efflux pump ArsB
MILEHLIINDLIFNERKKEKKFFENEMKRIISKVEDYGMTPPLLIIFQFHGKQYRIIGQIHSLDIKEE